MSSFPEQDSVPRSTNSPGRGDIRGRIDIGGRIEIGARGDIRGSGDVPGLGAIPGAGDVPGLSGLPGGGDLPRPAGSPDRPRPVVDIEEANRQLDLAAHDIAVASSCIGLGDLDEAHTNVITARAAADAAEEILRVVLASRLDSTL